MANWGATLVGLDGMLDTIDAVSDSLTNVEWKCGTNAKYSVHVEYGTSSMQANRAMRDAVEQVQRESDAIADRVDSTDELCKQLAMRIEELWKAGVRGELSGPERVDTANYLNSIRAEKVSQAAG